MKFSTNIHNDYIKLVRESHSAKAYFYNKIVYPDGFGGDESWGATAWRDRTHWDFPTQECAFISAQNGGVHEPGRYSRPKKSRTPESRIMPSVLQMNQYQKIRTYYEQEHRSIRWIAHKLHCIRDTVRKYIDGDSVPWDRKPGSGIGRSLCLPN